MKPTARGSISDVADYMALGLNGIGSVKSNHPTYTVNEESGRWSVESYHRTGVHLFTAYETTHLAFMDADGNFPFYNMDQGLKLLSKEAGKFDVCSKGYDFCCFRFGCR